jgi:hypothetical protein
MFLVMFEAVQYLLVEEGVSVVAMVACFFCMLRVIGEKQNGFANEKDAESVDVFRSRRKGKGFVLILKLRTRFTQTLTIPRGTIMFA